MTRRVGMLDSGLGGLTVLYALRERMPDTDVVYFADTAHVPYGDRTLDSVAGLGYRIVERLREHDPVVIVAASGTTCAAFDALGWPACAVPIEGVVDHGARAAVEVSRTGTIGVVATQATADSGVFERAIRELRPGATVISVGAPKLVPLVEAGDWESEHARDAVVEACRPVLAGGCDTAILGCTHYPHLQAWFTYALGPNVAIVDPSIACAAVVAKHLDGTVPASGRLVMEVSGDAEAFAATVYRLSEIPIDELHHVDLPLHAKSE